MNLRHIHNRTCTLVFAVAGALGGLAGTSVAQAANTSASSSIQSQYELDVQRCNTGQTHQSKAVCLQEAGAARDEANRKRLDDGQSANYSSNATDRCTKLPESQRQNCMQQMSSPSSVKGSVESGGVLRETVIQVPPQPSGTMPATGTQGATIPGTTMPSPAPGTVPGTTPSMPATPGAPAAPATPLPVQ